MTTVFLVTVPALLASMGQDADLLASVEPSLKDAISRATLRLGGFLRTAIYREIVEDIFYCDPYQMAPHAGKRHRFQLSNGLLREDMNPSVEVAETPDGPWTSITSNFLDYKKGLVTCPEEQVKERHVRISYESGFGTADEVDEPIRQAIMMLSPLMVLSSISTSLEPKQAAAATVKAKSLEDMSQDLLVPYMRNHGGWFKPIDVRRVDAMPPVVPGP